MAMRGFRRWSTLIRSKSAILVLAVIVGALTIAVGQEFARRLSIRQDQQRLSRQIAELESRQDELTGLLDRLKSESFQERQARLKLNLQRPGETTIIVSEDGTSSETTTGVHPAPTAEPTSNPVKWWRFFFS
jgi:cell division protein FtsB